ncbi:hypothetical protein RHMOL_Rhmol12G0099800 [Rhododendron molle]|uniref:Uncharacterized protein n=4 Tax=Rhododendron molle TaxID=49168 RepID=A0ACC0LGH3_RHOML|nr:hypothetical protein RHMOL_Rhmol12G0099800 [Rhododendron molle]KAI8527760.1 hypothetical protein RHMOL_Rhmol12G0099800 [Rhododendron molle]KAI8527761.1 hypothetical protein RHMOL_Rhmol12G0099800 [Rhododendron molle]KAI8527762.1 hypothetical protein RHMOL_Rhmol12G0099800 [Rhododendron molle]
MGSRTMRLVIVVDGEMVTGSTVVAFTTILLVNSKAEVLFNCCSGYCCPREKTLDYCSIYVFLRLCELDPAFFEETDISRSWIDDFRNLVGVALQAALVDAESKLSEAKMHKDSMLESKQLQLSRHLKELSQRNDQADKAV